MKVLIEPILDFFIPRFCSACKSKLPADTEFICKECFSKIKRAEKERIIFEFRKKFESTGIISDFTSHFLFEKDKVIQQIIHALKYEKRFLLGIFLGKLLGETIAKNFSAYSIDYITPIPLHHLKKAEREFNQSYYIAKGISTITGIKINDGLLKRIRYTESQTGMILIERDKNVNGAFAARKNLEGENILIVDDITTTGATMRECGRVLLNAGAGNIFGASIAIAD